MKTILLQTQNSKRILNKLVYLILFTNLFLSLYPCHLMAMEKQSVLVAPPNDDCSSVTPTEMSIGETAVFNGTTVGATTSSAELQSLIGFHPDLYTVWEAITLTDELSKVTVDLCGTTENLFDHGIVGYFTDCSLADSSFQYASNMEWCSEESVFFTYYHYYLPAGTYYFPIIGGPETSGNYVFTVNVLPVTPLPDSCEDNYNSEFEYTYPIEDILIASDLHGGNNGFLVYGIDLLGNYTSINIGLYNDDQRKPGSLLQEIEFTLVEQTLFYDSNNDNYDVYKYSYGFNSPISIESNSTYWLVYDYDGSFSVNFRIPIGYADVAIDPLHPNVWFHSFGEVSYSLHCDTLSVPDFDNNEVKISPNPVKDILTIHSLEKIKNVSIFSITGELLKSNISIQNEQLDVRWLTPGNYLLQFDLNDNSTKSLKFIKK